MSNRKLGVIGSPSMNQRSRCRSPAPTGYAGKYVPGTRCLAYLRRCLAIQLQKTSIFANNNSSGFLPAQVALSSHVHDSEQDSEISSYWMYDSGYLIFQGFLEANLKCFWNGSLTEAMKVLEFKGYIAPGVLLVTGSGCALEVIRAAWSRNVLKPPNNYTIAVVGDVEDCLVEPISQGQFTPLPEALCWIILDMTASGQAAVIESICSRLQAAFPDMEKPSEQMVYDTLAKLMTEKKLYQTANGYFIMTPDKLRLNNAMNRDRHHHHNRHHDENNHKIPTKQLLLTPEEAAVVIHGEIETVRDGNITHQSIQTNLADVICGGNPNDKILYPRIPTKIRSGFSAERLERRHSMRFFSSGRQRSSSLQRTGSVRHISSDCKRETMRKDSFNNDDISKKNHSLLSRIFRRSVRMKRDNSLSPVRRSTFCTQFPPAEWFNKGVTHLHSVGTQTSYTISDLDMLPQRILNGNEFGDDMSLISQQQQHRLSSIIATPRSMRRISHSATLPRRHISKLNSSSYGTNHDKENISRISSQNSIIPDPSIDETLSPLNSPDISSQSSISSNKTIIRAKESHLRNQLLSTAKSLSSTSSGYNSLPRSNTGGKNNSRPLNQKSQNKYKSDQKKWEPSSIPESSISLHVSTSSNTLPNGVLGFSNECQSNIRGNVLKSSIKSSPLCEKNSTTMTTTINSGNSTKIFVQQQNSPTRSLITFENNVDKTKTKTNLQDNVIIVNQPSVKQNNSTDKEDHNRPIRPASLYARQNYFSNFRNQSKEISDTYANDKESVKIEETASDNYKTTNESNCHNFEKLDLADRKSVNKDKEIYENGLNTENELNNTKNCASQKRINLSDDKNKSLNYKNLFKDQVEEIENIKKQLHMDLEMNNEPSSPMKCNFTAGSYKNLSLDTHKIDRIIKENDLEISSLQNKKNSGFPSLNDLSMHFTSLAAQNILKGVNLNSVDTLVEVNLAAEKNNCDVNVRTDLGFV